MDADDGNQQVDSNRTDKTKVDWHEVWLAKRKRYRDNVKNAKKAFDTKEEYLASDVYQKSHAKEETRKRWREVSLAEADKFFHKPIVAFDLSYDDSIQFQDLRSLASQMMFSYGVLRRSDRPLKCYITSLQGKALDALTRLSGFESWKMFKEERQYSEVFDKSKIVYLSPDATDVLQTVDEDAVYIIGGIVDDNKLTNLSLGRAAEAGVRAARLPILEHAPEYLNLSLCINHVFGIIQDVAQTGNWTEAIRNNAPNRFKKETRNAKDEAVKDLKFKKNARKQKAVPDTSATEIAAIATAKDAENASLTDK